MRDRAFSATSALLFIASAGATLYLCRAMAGGMTMPGDWTMSMVWIREPAGSLVAAAGGFLVAWIVMMVAMMLPSLIPVLSNYRQSILALDEGGSGARTTLFGAGYFSVWAGIGIAAYALGMLVTGAEERWPALARSVPAWSGAVLMLAGCWQFTGWKARELARCRESLACEQGRHVTATGAMQGGLRLGAHCALCCGGLMVTLLVTGVMSVAGMLLIAVAITAERLAKRPDWVARTVGAGMLVVGAVWIARSLGS
ncbi:MAG TPA: DUF2182 domain-containing protein [Gemmatimonadaceae bacterium]|nr:DUF2182 domain-containing protein [Gemmatimonadaceae bacterium]